MAAPKPDPGAVDAYIAAFPEPTRAALDELRAAFRRALPGAVERISYRIPAYWSDGAWMYFAGYERHVGLYPVHDLPPELEAQASSLRSGAATLRFPLAEPVPVALVEEIVRAAAEEQRARRAAGRGY